MAGWIQSGVTITLEWAPDASPLTALASVTWEDITAYARDGGGVRIHRGRSTELTPFSPGTMTVVLNNTSRLFDASNTAGSYYGKLLPMKRIRYSVVYGGVTAVLFTGYVLGWPISYPGMTDSVVTIECVDAFRIANQTELPGSVYASAILADSPLYYWPMQETSNETFADLGSGGLELPSIGSVLNTSAQYIDDNPDRTDAFYPLGEPAQWTGTLNAVYQDPGIDTLPKALAMHVGTGTDTTEVNFYFIYVDPDHLGVKAYNGRIELRYSNTSDNRTLSTAAGITLFPPADLVASGYFLSLTVSATQMKVYLNGELFYTDTLAAGTYSFGAANRVFIQTGEVSAGSHFVAWATAPSADRIKAHYQAAILANGSGYGEQTGTRMGRILDSIGWPSADRDISTGVTYTGQWETASATALAALRECETAEQGLMFVSGDGKWTFRDRQWQLSNTRATTAQVTFGDTANVPYQALTVDANQADFIRNTITVTANGSSVTAKDSTSRTNYGIQSETVDASIIPTKDGWIARQLANFRLRARKDPAIRVPKIEIQPRVAIATAFACASLELGDRVVVNRTPTGGSGSISAKCQVQGIDHFMSADEWVIGLNLAPAPKSYSEGPYLTLGDATYGKVGAADGNMIAA